MNSTASPSISTRLGSRITGRQIKIAFFSACLALVVVAYAFSRPLEDFLEYWTAAHLLMAHKNPYSLPEMFHMQQTLGWRQPVPLMSVTPPWALPFIALLGFFKSYALAWLAWVAILTLFVALSSRLLMDLYFGDLSIPEISDTPLYRCLLAFTFYPVLISLKFAQVAPILLLGVAGFLYFEKKQRTILAGVLLSLTALKPQLGFLVWLAVFVKSWNDRRWKTFTSAVVVVALLTAIALLLDHQAIQQYWELARGPYLHVFLSGVVGVVRGAFGGRNTFWLQFAPPLIGLIWFAFYWHRHQKTWSWFESMPVLVTASLLTTAYGWLFDQALLVVPIIALAAKHAKELGRLPRNLVVLYTALNITLILAAMASTPWTFVPAPVLTAVLLLREARARPAISLEGGF